MRRGGRGAKVRSKSLLGVKNLIISAKRRMAQIQLSGKKRREGVGRRRRRSVWISIMEFDYLLKR